MWTLLFNWGMVGGESSRRDEQILLVMGHLPPSPPVWKTVEVTSVTMKEPFHLHNFITKKLFLKLLM